MIKFLCLGSGSSGNCYYLSTGHTHILIDAGVGIRAMKKYAREYALPLADLTAVLVTHDHADHIKAVGYMANDYHAHVYSTRPILDGIRRNYCVTNNPADDTTTAIEKDVPFRVGDFEVEAFDVPHDSTDCVGYTLRTADETFCLITDIGHVTARVEQAVHEATYLVVEANHDLDMLAEGPYPAHLKGRIRGGEGHLNNTLAGMLLAEHATPALRHVWLCHLSEENNHPELARKTVTQILKEYGIIVGVEFELDVLRRRVPSGVFEL